MQTNYFSIFINYRNLINFLERATFNNFCLESVFFATIGFLNTTDLIELFIFNPFKNPLLISPSVNVPTNLSSLLTTIAILLPPSDIIFRAFNFSIYGDFDLFYIFH